MNNKQLWVMWIGIGLIVWPIWITLFNGGFLHNDNASPMQLFFWSFTMAIVVGGLIGTLQTKKEKKDKKDE